ncbi:MAG: threonylcarbamoyl-AMP synthase [Lachnospiraceae bacterium]|nr:threonylcarbamoyl-AMP synthase [Lachnospiraceae bacterium]
MNTKFITLDTENPDPSVLKEAGEIIKRGGLVAFPTETVYGLGGDALNPESSKKIYAAKGRPSDNPLIVHIWRLEDLPVVAREIPDIAYKLAAEYWPGPLTMIFRKSDAIPFETTGGLDTVAVRFPDNKIALGFIKEAGGFVAAPSANLSGKPSPTLSKYVKEDMDGRIEMILDGGQVGIGLESTIIDLTSEVPTILRPGFITREMLLKLLNEVDVDKTILDGNSKAAPKAPGMKYRHYAPKGDLTVIEGETSKVISYINEKTKEAVKDGKKVCVICTDETEDAFAAKIKKSVGSRADEASVGKELYRVLRECDDEDIEVIFSESFDATGFGQAIMNRLLKAAGHHVINVD